MLASSSHSQMRATMTAILPLWGILALLAFCAASTKTNIDEGTIIFDPNNNNTIEPQRSFSLDRTGNFQKKSLGFFIHLEMFPDCCETVEITYTGSDQNVIDYLTPFLGQYNKHSTSSAGNPNYVKADNPNRFMYRLGTIAVNT